MLERDRWLDFARKLDWEFSYVEARDVFPEATSGRPWLSHDAWRAWDEPFRTTFAEYVTGQAEKDASVRAVRDALGHVEALRKLPASWRSAWKLHGAVLPLAEFAATIGNLRAARFGRDAAWRSAALLGALDELRHTQIPLGMMHALVRVDPQFDFVHRFYHSNDWVAIAARHFADELFLGSDAIEFAIATNFVFETGFTNLQFVGLTSLAHETSDPVFEKMLASIQSDEARHAQIGPAVLEILVAHDKPYAQALLDKWFWRSFLLFAIVTGFSMDYLTPVEHRTSSFKEFVHEWVIDQYTRSLARFGLERPPYWETFLEAVDHYHHMVYASAYAYRMTVWFDLVVPSPEDRAWLREKYPTSWPSIDPVWTEITARWEATDVGNDLGVHGTSIVGFCHLCQLVLCGGTPERNTACTLEHEGALRIFCSEPCRAIFAREPERYAAHRDVVGRVLEGRAPGNLAELVRTYFGLTRDTWGKDATGGEYPFVARRGEPAPGGEAP